VAREPRLILHKLRLIDRPARPESPDDAPVVPPPLRLQAGEWIRVKPFAEIRKTLDEVGDCEGMGFMPMQTQFCGAAFPVRRRVEHFFDERTRRMLQVKNTVILDGVYCEPPPTGQEDYAGCSRSCFLFWKEAWLERA
jgi:hypothetical protein